jgi:hypothetical protein
MSDCSSWRVFFVVVFGYVCICFIYQIFSKTLSFFFANHSKTPSKSVPLPSHSPLITSSQPLFTTHEAERITGRRDLLAAPRASKTEEGSNGTATRPAMSPVPPAESVQPIQSPSRSRQARPPRRPSRPAAALAP